MFKETIGRLGKGFVVILLIWTLSACAKTMALESDYSTIAKPTLDIDQPIPVPKSAVLLTVQGKVGTHNAEDEIHMDRETLEAVGLVQYSVVDPFEERTVEYTGVLMRDLLDLWQIADDATHLYLVALNDYNTQISIDDLKEYPIMLALKSDGEYMTPDYRGPLMIVYPLHNYEFEMEQVHSNWIWQLTTIEVR